MIQRTRNETKQEDTLLTFTPVPLSISGSNWIPDNCVTLIRDMSSDVLALKLFAISESFVFLSIRGLCHKTIIELVSKSFMYFKLFELFNTSSQNVPMVFYHASLDRLMYQTTCKYAPECSTWYVLKYLLKMLKGRTPKYFPVYIFNATAMVWCRMCCMFLMWTPGRLASGQC